MRKISSVLFLSFFLGSLSLTSEEFFSEYDIVMKEQEYDTREFVWADHEEDGDIEEYWDTDAETEDDLAKKPQEADASAPRPIKKGNPTDKDKSANECQAHLDIEPSSIVNGSVNVINGCYMNSEVDFVFPGAEPFILQRNYISTHTDKHGPFGQGWSRNYFGFIKRKVTDRNRFKKNRIVATVLESGGAMYQYGSKQRHSMKLIPECYEKAVTNCGGGLMGGHTNIKNNLLNYEEKDGLCDFWKSTGEKLIFKQYEHRYEWRLAKEAKGNGNQLEYTYLEDGQLGKVVSRNAKGMPLGEMTFTYGEGNEREFIFLHNNGKRKVAYELQHFKSRKVKKSAYITSVARDCAPKVTYEYEDKQDKANIARVVRLNKPEKRFQEIDYYKRGSNWVGNERVNVKHHDSAQLDRVMLQKAPVGHDATPVITHRYFYKSSRPYPQKKGVARVYDAYDHRTDYQWDKHQRLQEITHFSGKDTHRVHKRDCFEWGDFDHSKGTFLLRKFTKDANDTVLFMRTFAYDEDGNVKQDVLYGNLSGESKAPCGLGSDPSVNGCELFHKSFTYYPGERYLMATMTEGKVTQTFYYKKGTNLLKAKLFSTKGTIFKREFYVYDENAALVMEIEDDGESSDQNNLQGVTERYIRSTIPRKSNPIGLPEVVEEKYVDVKTGEERLLKKWMHHYDENGRLRAKELFDASSASLCTFEWKYDAHGNVIREINPLGQKTIRRYDANDNMIYEQGPNPEFHKEFVYDYSNRLVRADEIHTNGLLLSEAYRYNYLSQKVGFTDIYGNETTYEYDDFGNQTKTLLPPVVNGSGKPTIYSDAKAYNLFNAVKVATDFKGHTTTTDYNIRAKPIHTVYADGSSEKVTYYLNGTAAKHTHKNGSYTTYKYDHLKRVTSKKTFSPAGELLERFDYKYNTFHLLWEKDTGGHFKKYAYDAAGRLNEMIDGERRTTYAYDSVGRLYKTTEHGGLKDSVSSVQLFDLLDRVIEERREDADGNVLTRVTYVYDRDGNRKQVTTYSDLGKSITKTRYDNRHQPVDVIDALGNTTHIEYRYDYQNEHGQTVPYSVSVDPMGTITENVKDAQGRLVKLIQRNALNQIVHLKELFYDQNGNKVRQVDTPTNYNGKEKSPVVTKWTYDCMNRLTSITEAYGKPEQRHTEFVYNAFGQKSQIIKPDGVKINYTYDDLGRVKDQTSSDKSIHYHSIYDAQGNLERVEDRVHKLQSSFTYDKFDRMESETLSNGLKIGYKFDKANRPKIITFPDGTGVEYTYKAHRLVNVNRLSAEKRRTYSHRYLSYDLEDKLLGAKLIEKAGNAKYGYDLLGRSTTVVYDAWDETISGYDKVGNILTRELADPHGKVCCQYKYDDLYQVSAENEVLEKSEDQPEKTLAKRTYRHDSLYNRVSKGGSQAQFNKLNQLLNDGTYRYTYDLNGNLISKIALSAPQGSEPEQLFSYDALDRLIAISSKQSRVSYIYDANNRRVSKRFQARGEGNKPWVTVNKVHYIYIGQNEVGSYTDTGEAIDLRLLGVSKGAEIGAAVAIELHGEVYAPLHDHQGNVTALIDAKSGDLVESYRYSAFGEEQVLDAEGHAVEAPANPWRFSSKRVDGETGFVYFGRRYYDPQTARWISPDPIGREGGPNLYAYVLNRALTHSDLYGLYPESEFCTGIHGIDFAFNWTKTFLNDFTRFTAMTINFAGSVIDQIGYHCVPIPIARDILQIGGRILSGRGFDDYHFMFCGEHVIGDLGRPECSSTIRNALIGGIGTSWADMKARALIQSERLGDCNVHYCATASDGLLLDFCKAFGRCIGPFRSDTHTGEFLTNLNNSMTGPESERRILLDVHSQGALVTHNAQSKIAEICKRTDVYSYGGAEVLDPNKFRSVSSYISDRDIIPFVSSPLSYISAKLYPRSDVHFLKSTGLPFMDHGWDCNTYQTEIRKNSEYKKSIMGLG